MNNDSKQGPHSDPIQADVDRVARELLAQHGQGVRQYLAEQIRIARSLRDSLSVGVWREIAGAIKRLQSSRGRPLLAVAGFVRIVFEVE